jgi:hypothetical protein
MPERPMIVSSRSVLVFGVYLAWLGTGLARGDENVPAPKNVMIIGKSSLTGLPELVAALLESNQTPMNVEPGHHGTPDFERRWASGKKWDYIIMDAWQFTRGSTELPGFADATAEFVKKVRDHSPNCQIILFPWWLPQNSATNEDVREVFHHCVEAARVHGLWVATTGPAFQEARLARSDLKIVVSRQDAHPGLHGGYLNACSLFAILTDKSPAGLPAKEKVGRREEELAITKEDAAYLQEHAWKVYQRELKHTKPAKKTE